MKKKTVTGYLDESTANYQLFFTNNVKVFQRSKDDDEAFALITYSVGGSVKTEFFDIVDG